MFFFFCFLSRLKMAVEARIKTSLVLICFTLVTWAVGHCLYQDGIGQEIRTQGLQPEQSIRLKHPAGVTDHQGKRLSKHARDVQRHNTSVFSGKAHSIGDMHKTSNNTERVTDDFQADDTDTSDAFGIEMNRHEGQKSKKIEQLEKLHDADVFDTAGTEPERLSIVKPDNSGFKPHHDESYHGGFRSDQAWSSDASPSSSSSSSSSPYDAPPPPAFGLFAAVQELVLTVKDLHAQQDRDRCVMISQPFILGFFFSFFFNLNFLVFSLVFLFSLFSSSFSSFFYFLLSSYSCIFSSSLIFFPHPTDLLYYNLLI